MRKMHGKGSCAIAVALAVMMSFAAVTMGTAKSKAEVTTQCTTYDGDNMEDQNYSTYGTTVKSYLTACNDGSLMRFQYGSKLTDYLVEYYDTSYNLTRTVMVDKELPLFGAFYETESNYYILSGQNNSGESDDVEVYRITKYDKSWNRLGSCGLFGANTYIPFDAGSARMTHSGKYLLIRTCHEMYQSSDGKHHQANVTIQVDMDTMTITDSYYIVMNSNYGYISHSFNQFIGTDGNHIVAVDHGDANPRGIALVQYQTDFTTGKFTPSYSNPCTVTNLVEMEDYTNYNYTGVSIGGFEISDTAYIVAGNKDISATNTSGGRNIFVAAKNKSTGAVSMNYITDYAEGSSSVTGATTPHLIKLGSNSYMLLWNKEGVTYYTKIDGNGKQSGGIYHIEGDLSDCVPLVTNGSVIWYTWKNGLITFYDISTSNLSVNHKTEIENGHRFVYGQPDENHIVTKECSVCGYSEKIYVPMSFVTWWKREGSSYYYQSYEARYDEGYELPLMISPSMPEASDPDITSNQEMEVLSSDESVIKVAMSGDTNGKLIMGMAGIATITIRAKYNPDIEKKYEFRVGAEGGININECQVTLNSTEYSYTGNAQTPEPEVKYNGYTLVKGKDYTLSGENNTEVGNAVLIISGAGIFGGSVEKAFVIKNGNLEDCTVTLSKDDFAYCGWARKPAVTIKNSGGAVVAESLYDVEYTNNTKVGTASVKITGKNGMAGSATKEFTISPCNLAECSVSLRSNAEYYVYSGAEKKPLDWVFNKDGHSISTSYVTITYEHNINAGTATVTLTPKEGYDCYTGSVSKSWVIEPLDITEFDMSLAQSTYVYDGTAVKPEMTVSSASHTVDLKGCNVEYENNINVGTAAVTVTGKGNYTGTVSKTYEITKCNVGDCEIELSQDSYNYDGTAKEPGITVRNGQNIIPSDQYTVSYSNNINIGTAVVTITGRNNCEGTVTGNYTITPPSVASCTVTLSQREYVYDGLAKTPEITLQDGSYTLIKDTDYTLSYQNNINAGTAEITITGKGNYTGVATQTYTIKAANIDTCSAVVEETGIIYDGSFKKPSVSFLSGGSRLALDKDYTVAYTNNKEVGIATVTITGTGNYKGTISTDFEIEAIDISTAKVSFSTSATDVYSGEACEKTPTVTIGGKTLQQNIDYTVSYENNINAGTASVIITGRYHYKGTAIGTFEILASDIGSGWYTLELDRDTFVYDGMEKVPEVTLTRLGSGVLEQDKDYTVTYQNNVNAGTATVTVTGFGNFKGTRSMTYEISKVDISDYDMTFAEDSYIYDGTAKKPEIIVGNGADILTDGLDYTVLYSNNVDAGTATATVTAKGNYSGTVSGTFEIRPLSVNASEVTLTGDFVYTGNSQKAAVTVQSGETVLTAGTDYTVAYTDCINAGTVDVTVNCIGNYTGSITKSYTIASRSLEDCAIELEAYKYMYDGTAKTPEMNVVFGNRILEKGVDYDITYRNNTEIGIAAVTVTAKGNYTGSVTENFEIAQYPFTDFEVRLVQNLYTYDGTAKTPEAVLFLGDKVLVLDEDYTVEYRNHIHAGTATAVFTGIGTFEGELTADYEIAPLDIGKSKEIVTSLDHASYTFDNTEKTPAVTVTYNGVPLLLGEDYTVRYNNNKAVGTAKVVISGKGNYTGVAEAAFTINAPASLYCTVKAVATEKGMELTWNAAACEQYYVYRMEAGSDWVQICKVMGSSNHSYIDTTAVAGHSYSYAVCAVWPGGKPSVPTKDYAGSGTPSTFLKCCTVKSLTNVSSGIKIKWSKVTGASGYMVYRKTGNAKKWTRIKVVTGGRKVSYTDKTVKSRNGKIYTYMVKAFSGQYTKPAGVSTFKGKQIKRLTSPKLMSVKPNGSKRAKVIWKRNSKATGYQIQYSTGKSFAKGKKTVTVKGARKTAQTLKKLTKGKKYYVRIRAYYKSGKTRYYSPWSVKKAIKIK